ncbi:trafficking protein particle complex subunit 11 [Bacillus rossius redtenbacheri]|uniref:trafficking protein particle complex subunit 11 n=1 Tax=Bacillus rossius redtenbacheri TaxID=93214 RepID=UPI002FDED369
MAAVPAVPQDYLDFPPELVARPLALVGLTGLDALHNAVHRAIWEAFSGGRRAERASVLFKLLDPAHDFPPVKPRRSSYDWYIPKGILKRNWMAKHLDQVPAVVVVFYELDWDDAQWNEKKIECASRVQSIRAALEGRGTRTAVILIQRVATLPTGEDMLTAERAASLCSSCDLNPKSLFVLPMGDHLHGYTLRLENAFFDLAQNYYHHEARNVRSHRDHLNKTTHQYLFVRHLFKMGFLCELKQDHHTAHKHYSQAYSALLDLRLVDTNALEIKTVAGFLNYKLCSLMFQLNLPRDAIAQFKKHVDLFRPRTGVPDLAFEHAAWLSKQFGAFGDVFDETIRQGLPALQTQHPGFYYQQAAQHASERKQLCARLCQGVTEYPEPDPLAGWEQLEFYGQRPWRPGKLSAEPPDPAKERSAFQALQFLERFRTDHSMLIIGLLGNAISQFKTYRCPRMRRHLVVQMAEEYFSSKDYTKSLTLLTHMLWDYRSERWWALLSNILSRALLCAYLSASVQDYVALALEALGSAVQLAAQHKTHLYDNLARILKKVAPEPEPGVPADEAARVAGLWAVASGAEPLVVSVDMSNITACVECRAGFCQPSYKADQPVDVEVYIRSTCPHPLQLTCCTLVLASPGRSEELQVCADPAALLLRRGEARRLRCTAAPRARDAGRELQVGAVQLRLGSARERAVLLCFRADQPGGCAAAPACPELQHFRYPPRGEPDMDACRLLASTQIAPQDSRLRLEVSQESPALIGEWYRVDVAVGNGEELPAAAACLEVGLRPGDDDPGIEQSTQLCEDLGGELLSLPMRLPLGDLAPGDTGRRQFYLRAHRVGTRALSLKVSYTLTTELEGEQVESACVKEEEVDVPVSKPFDVTAKFYSLKFEPVAKAFAKEAFIVMPYVNCTSPFPLVVEDSSVELRQQVGLVDGQLRSQVKGLRLEGGDVGSEAFCVAVERPSEQPVALGVYTLQWHREGARGVATSSSVTLPAVQVEDAPLQVQMVLPAHGWVRTPMAVSYRLTNHTSQLLQLSLSLEASDAFMFAGHKQLRLRILPQSERALDYNLYPLLSGLVALPRLQLAVPEGADCPVRPAQLAEILERTLPAHVYVMPQCKGNPTSVPVLSPY